ncbi:hypothetical protein Esi_0285_0022 [Ectocarpus siliculosus]|uniref:Uncharacterized protein n=1 Tax=Ectocarpus siliculosus TaxID=2880 RepID=D7FV07_ECTSI|nr:hypothetical protein Esi_0285_0022 [Ectocarpus siliculosus]|eukprot:CBJ31813.1 hypothetical protein Esi_0285_0022 [Ectocarpus siliculosus]
MRVVSQLFSVSLGPDTFARIGLDERQEVSNRLYKTLTKRISSTIEKLAPIAQLREVAIFNFESHFIEKPRTERDRCRELAVKRAPAVRAAMDCLRESPAFKGDDGKDKVVALDGRVFPPVKWQEIIDAAAKARAKMHECVLYYVFKKKKLKGTTKKKVFSIPARNSTNKATKSQGRSSALKDSVGNSYAGGQEWKVLKLNMFDAAREGGGVVTQDQMLEMVASIGAATPYSMANATGGAKHANKAAGPGKWVREHGADGFADDPFYEADAHGVGLPVPIHQGVHPEYLEKGTAGIIDYFRKQLLSKWLQSTELLVVGYDRQELVPVINGHEQLGRSEKLGEPDLSADHPPGVDVEGIGLEMAREGAGEALPETEPLLHFRDGTDTIEGVERQRGPDIGEAELSVIHFIAWAKKYWGKSFDKWVVSSVDTDLWMNILLAMTTGWLTPRGERAVDVTVLRVVGGETKFLWMNRVFASICELQDESESAWPPLIFGSWIPTDNDKMWVLVLKSVRTEGLFDKPLFFEEYDGTWAVDVDECAKLLATLFFYKDEAAFGTAHLTPAQVVQSVDGDVEAYVSVIRYAILQLPKKKTTATCPSYYSLRKKAERGNAIFRY